MVGTWFVCHERWHTTLFGVYYCVEPVRIENNSHMLEISVFEVFLSVYGTFSQKEVEIFRIEKNSHTIHITC